MWTEDKQPVQCDSEEFRLRVVVKAGDVGNDCRLPIRLMGTCGEECHFACVAVEEALHSATAETARCSSFSAISLLW